MRMRYYYQYSVHRKAEWHTVVCVILSTHVRALVQSDHRQEASVHRTPRAELELRCHVSRQHPIGQEERPRDVELRVSYVHSTTQPLLQQKVYVSA